MKKLFRTKAGQKVLSAALSLNAKRYTSKKQSNEGGSMADLNAIFTAMGDRFNAQAAGSLEAVFQYQIEDGEPWFVAISEGVC